MKASKEETQSVGPFVFALPGSRPLGPGGRCLRLGQQEVGCIQALWPGTPQNQTVKPAEEKAKPNTRSKTKLEELQENFPGECSGRKTLKHWTMERCLSLVVATVAFTGQNKALATTWCISFLGKPAWCHRQHCPG